MTIIISSSANRRPKHIRLP